MPVRMLLSREEIKEIEEKKSRRSIHNIKSMFRNLAKIIVKSAFFYQIGLCFGFFASDLSGIFFLLWLLWCCSDALIFGIVGLYNSIYDDLFLNNLYDFTLDVKELVVKGLKKVKRKKNKKTNTKVQETVKDENVLENKTYNNDIIELLYECSSKIKDLDKTGKFYYLNKLNEIAHEYKEKHDKLMDNKDSNKYNLSIDNEFVLRNVTINKIISIEYEIDMMIRNQKEKQEFNKEMSSLYDHFNSIANEEVFNFSDKVYQMSYKKLN